jgi:hypothetical protein
MISERYGEPVEVWWKAGAISGDREAGEAGGTAELKSCPKTTPKLCPSIAEHKVRSY